MERLPTSELDRSAILELLKVGELVLGSNGSAMDLVRETFASTVASADLTTIYMSAHEARGEPHESGRAELFGVVILVKYGTVLLDYHDETANAINPIYCDNMDAVKCAEDQWIGKTPRWADSRNIDPKLQLRQLLENFP